MSCCSSQVVFTSFLDDFNDVLMHKTLALEEDVVSTGYINLCTRQFMPEYSLEHVLL